MTCELRSLMQYHRLMTMSPMYICSQPCSTGTHNETVKKLTLFSALMKGIMIESRLRISNPVRFLSVLQSNRNFYHNCCNHSNNLHQCFKETGLIKFEITKHPIEQKAVIQYIGSKYSISLKGNFQLLRRNIHSCKDNYEKLILGMLSNNCCYIPQMSLYGKSSPF